VKRALPLLLLALLPAAVVAAAGSDAHRSPAIYPQQQIPLRFDHQQHLDLDMKCIACHEVDSSRKAGDRNIPPQATCESCHDIEAAAKGEETDPPSACAVCHPGFDASAMKRPPVVVMPANNLVFDHKLHLDRGVACSTCHGDLAKVQLATRAQLPKMQTCLGCHRQGGSASGECSTCHFTSASGKLAQILPGGARLVPEFGNPFGVAHGPRYEREHGPDAMAQRTVCSKCHGESDCLACHDGTFKNLLFHPNDWITLHPVPAKLSSLECTSCHRSQSFCIDCHERAGIGGSPTEGPQASRSIRFHPAGWEIGDGPSGHGPWASRNINTCISCHREEDCLKCHATANRSTLGGNNPHPPGFRAQATAICRSNPRVCVRCHEKGDTVLGACL
jgi:hypothetical protein